MLVKAVHKVLCQNLHLVNNYLVLKLTANYDNLIQITANYYFFSKFAQIMISTVFYLPEDLPKDVA